MRYNQSKKTLVRSKSGYRKRNLSKTTTQLQAALLQLTRQALSSINMEEVLGLLSEQVRLLMKADLVTTAMIENLTLVKSSYKGPDQGEFDYKTIGPAYLAGKALGGLAYNTGQIVACNDYWHDDSFEHDPAVDTQMKKSGVVAALAVPIILAGQVVALMWINKFRPYQWSKTDLLQAEQFAEIAALAIQNARLYRHLEILNLEMDTHNRQLNARNQELVALQEFNRRLRGPVDLKATTRLALSLAMEVLQSDTGTLHLVNRQNPQELLLAIHLGEHEFNSPQNLPSWLSRIEVGCGVIGQVAQTGQMILINNLAEWNQQHPGVLLNPNPVWRSSVFIPLVAAEKVIGVLGQGSIQPSHFSPERVRFAEMIAGQIATAVQQVTQIETQKQRERLEAVLTLARTAAHDLNQPLAVLQGLLDLTLSLGENPDEEMLQIMQETVTIMAERVREYQKIVRIETTEVVPGIHILDRVKAVQN